MKSEVPIVTFRSKDSTCPLVFSKSQSQWAVGDDCGTVYQCKANENGKMSELRIIGEEPILDLAMNEGGDECALAHGTEVDVLSFPAMDTLESMVVRSTQPITHVEYDPEGGHIFVSSRSPDVAVYSKVSRKEETKVSTHGVGVRTFAIDPTGEYIGILDEGRDLTISRLLVDRGVLGKRFVGSNQEHKCSKFVHADVVRKYEKFGCSMSWHPTALCLAVPSEHCSIFLIEKALEGSSANWEEQPLVFASVSRELQHTEMINAVQFSPNGLYLASADTAGAVLVWDMAEKRPIRRLAFNHALFGLRWGPTSNDNYIIAVTATSCGKADEVINTAIGLPLPALPVGKKAPVAPAAPKSPGVTSSANSALTNSAKKVILSPPPMAADKKVTERHSRIKKLGGNKPEEDDDDNLFTDAADQQFSIDAIKLLKDEDDAKQTATKLADVYMDDMDGFVEKTPFAYMNPQGEVDSDIVPAYIHQPIEPSSTPFDEKRRRYMIWNLVGSIVCREEDSGNRIEIKFADTSGKNKNLSFLDTDEFAVASLSYEGAVFANRPEDPELDDLTGLPIGDSPNTSDKKGSDVHYHAFQGQTQLDGANETFSMTLPVGEIVDCCAVGMGWAAVATSKNLLRIFSSTGLQISVTWLRGPVVCTTGHGSRLAVIYNDGGSLSDGTPNLAVECFHVSRSGIKQESLVKVPVSPGGALLHWAGFTEDGILYIMDSAGMLSALMHIAGWQWVPLLDTAKASKKIDHKFWPICVKSSNLCYVLLNGENNPLVYPAPVVSTKSLSPPIVEYVDSRDKIRAEAENERSRMLLLEYCSLSHVDGLLATTTDLDELGALEEALHKRKAEADKVLIKIFNEACRLQKNALSSDVALRLHTVSGIEIAIRVAEHYDRPGLIRLLNNVLRQKEEDMMADQIQVAPAHAAPRGGAPPAPQPLKKTAQSAPYHERTPPREQNTEDVDPPSQHEYEASSGKNEPNHIVTPSTGGFFNKKVAEDKRKNILGGNMRGHANNDSHPRPLAPPVNKFAQSSSPMSPISQSKKRSYPHEELRNLKTSPSPKKPALNLKLDRSVCTTKT